MSKEKIAESEDFKEVERNTPLKIQVECLKESNDQLILENASLQKELEEAKATIKKYYEALIVLYGLQTDRNKQYIDIVLGDQSIPS